MAFGSAVGVFLAVLLLTCSLVAWVSPCWIAVLSARYFACCFACFAGC